MIHRYITKKQNNEHIIVGTRLVSEYGEPRTPLDIPKPNLGDILDQRDRPRYAISTSGEVYERTIVDTPEELQRDRRHETQNRIRRQYSMNDELAILRRALINGINEEAREYSEFVESVINDVKEGNPTHQKENKNGMD